MRTRNKIPMLLFTLVTLTFGVSPVQATPDTDVANKQNYSTDVIYQIITDRLVDGNTANNPTGSSFSADCSQKKLYCGGDWKGRDK
jgi:hypothetical protein